MNEPELSRIEKQVWIRAPRARVWRALTDTREFGNWFGAEIAGDFRPGTSVEMTSTHESCKGQKGILEIQEMIPERRFSWRWHPGVQRPEVDYSKEPTTLVEFHLEDSEGGTLLKVVESGFDRISLARRAGVFAENEGGWAYQMNAISTYVGQTP